MRCRTARIARRSGCRPSLQRGTDCRRIQWQHAEWRGNRLVTSPESPSQPSSSPPPSPPKVARRWRVIASGLLILALALVVIYTAPNAFYSPVALVTVSAIGLAALLLQGDFRRDLPNIHSPLWLNVLGILCAVLSLVADYLRLTRVTLDAVAFTAIV